MHETRVVLLATAVSVAVACTAASDDDMDCASVPDGCQVEAEDGLDDEAPHLAFVPLFTSSFPLGDITWSIGEPPQGVTPEAFAEIAQEVFDIWTQVLPRRFVRVPSDGSLRIATAKLDGRSTFDSDGGKCEASCGLATAIAPFRASFVTLWLDIDEVWSSSKSPPPNRSVVDLRRVMLHEMGHLLGFDHSPDTKSVMFFRYTAATPFSLTDDERLGIRATYGEYREIPVPAPVIDVHAAPLAIVTKGTDGDNAIYRSVGSDWERVPGTATRISADGSGRLWIVRADGTIHALDANSAWVQIPGCASDIGVTRAGRVWIVACDGTLQSWRGDAQTDDALERTRASGFAQATGESGASRRFKNVSGYLDQGVLAVDATGQMQWLRSGDELLQFSTFRRQEVADVGAALERHIWSTGVGARGVFALANEDEGFEGEKHVSNPARDWSGQPQRAAERISVDADGKPVIVDGGRLYTVTK